MCSLRTGRQRTSPAHDLVSMSGTGTVRRHTPAVKPACGLCSGGLSRQKPLKYLQVKHSITQTAVSTPWEGFQKFL